MSQVQMVGRREGFGVEQHAAIDGLGHVGGAGFDVGVMGGDDAEKRPWS